MLALEVVFPVPLGRDPSLVQVFFVKGPIHSGLDRLPVLIPATFVHFSRAYLLDPEPGTYSVVAVNAAYAPPWLEEAVAGVAQTTWSGTSSDAMIFPAELIDRTRTTIGRGQVVYMGRLAVGRGDRIDANVGFADELQRRIAEQLRPGVTSESGFAGWLKRTRKVDLASTSFADSVDEEEAFFASAPADLGSSPWAEVIARATPTTAAAIRANVRAARRGSDVEDAQAGARAGAKHGPEAPSGGAVTPPSRSTEPESALAPPSSESETAIAVSPSPPSASDREAEAEPATATAGLRPLEAEPESVPPPSGAQDPAPATIASRGPEPAAARARPAPEPRPFPGIPPESALYGVESGMSHHEVREILGDPDGRFDRQTSKAWIPFYSGPGADLRDWSYTGKGRVVFTLYRGKLEVVDVVYDPDEGS